MPDPFPSRGRLAGIDYGHVRIGIALCDPDRRIASPFETYARSTAERDASYFRRLVQEERVVGFVVGLPVHASAAESAKSQEARRFGQWLSEVAERPVCFFDERYTTVEASELLREGRFGRKRRKQRLDKLAAQILLAAFLESTVPGDPPESLEDTRDQGRSHGA